MTTATMESKAYQKLRVRLDRYDAEIERMKEHGLGDITPHATMMRAVEASNLTARQVELLYALTVILECEAEKEAPTRADLARAKAAEQTSRSEVERLQADVARLQADARKTQAYADRLRAELEAERAAHATTKTDAS